MLSDGDPRQIRKRIFICACVPAIDLFDDILIHRKRLIYECRTNLKQQRLSPGHCRAALLRGAPGARDRPRSSHASAAAGI